MTRARPELSELEARLGYRFTDATLAARALTHVSAPTSGRAQSYQRLEFLGDRVLGLVVSEMLYEAFPAASEGELSVRLARLVLRVSRGRWVRPVLRAPRARRVRRGVPASQVSMVLRVRPVPPV